MLGLVFDGRQRIAYLCDPNGSLMPGGNMYDTHIFLRSLSLYREQGNAVVALDERPFVRWKEGHNFSITV